MKVFKSITQLVITFFLINCYTGTAYAQFGNLNKLKDKASKVKDGGDKGKDVLDPTSGWVNNFDNSMRFLKAELSEGYIGSGADRNIAECENAIDSVKSIKPTHNAIARMESELAGQKNIYAELNRTKMVKIWSDRFENIIGIIEGDLAKGYVVSGTARKFEECAQALDSVRQYDSASTEIARYEAKYDEQARIKYVIEKTDEFDRFFGKVETGISSYRTGSHYTEHKNILARSRFDSTRTEFIDDNLENASLTERFALIEQFYSNKSETAINSAIIQLSSIFNSSNYWAEENRKTEAFFEEFNEVSNPKKSIDNLGYGIKLCAIVSNIFINEDRFTPYLDSIKIRKQDLDNFVSSGEYDEWKEKDRLRTIDKVIPFKNLRSDASIIASVKAGHTPEDGYGKIIKVIIIESDWAINKLYNGKISSKSISVQIVTKDDDGRCWLGSSHVKKEYYEGTYGKPKYWNGPSYQEMNCDNFNKSISVPKS